MTIHGDIKWTKVKETWQLSNGEELMLSLGTKIKGARPLYLEGRSFHILEKGTWNAVWYIETKKKEKILQMIFGFWSSKAKISFNDGSQYECYFRNFPSFQVVIHDLRYREDLIRFQVDNHQNGKLSPKMIFHRKEMFTDKLLFLAALGMTLLLDNCEEEFDFVTFLLLPAT